MEPNGTLDSEDVVKIPLPGLAQQQSTESCGSTTELLAEEEKAVQKYKCIKLTALTFLGISFGLCGGLTGTTLLDIMDNIEADVNMGQLSLAIAFKNLGALIGSLGSGMIGDRYQKNDLLLTCGLVILGLMALCKPFVTYLATLTVVFFLDGISVGVLGAIGSVMPIQTFGDHGDAAIQLTLTGFAVGFALAPLLAWPFITERSDEEDTLSTLTWMTTTWNYNVTQVEEEVQESRIYIPYTIAAITAFIMAAVFLAFHFAEPPKGFKLFFPLKKSWQETMSPGSCAGGDSSFSVWIITLSVLLFAMHYVREILMDTYLYAVAIEGNLGFSSDEAVVLDFSCKLSFFIGRTLAIPLAYFCPAQPIFHTVIYLTALLGVLLATVGTETNIALWVISCVWMFLTGPIWGSGFSWLDKYIILYAVIMGLIQIGHCIFGISLNILAGFLYSEYYPETVFYIVGLTGLVAAVLLPPMQVMASRHGNRYRAMEREADESQDVKPELSLVVESTKM